MSNLLSSKRFKGSALNLVAVVALSMFIPMLVTAKSSINIVWTCCVFVLMAVSLNIVMGFMGQLALGHCGFMAIGAYVSTFIANVLYNAGFFTDAYDYAYYVVLFASIILGGLVSGLIGLLVGIPALRLRGDYLAIITLGFNLIVVSVLNNIAGPTLYTNRMVVSDNFKYLYLTPVIAVTCVCVALMFTFIRSKYGRALMSIRDDDIASSASGININYYKIFGFAFSSFFAGIAGVLFSAMMSSLNTTSFAFTNSSIYNSIFIVVMVVLGGMGSMTGSVVTAIGMVILNNFISAIPSSSFMASLNHNAHVLYKIISAIASYPLLLYALVLIVFIMFRPKGIFGTKEFSLYNTFAAIGEKIKGKKAATEGGNNND